MQVSKKAIARSGRSVLAASDQLDDGSPITLRVELDSECGGALFDFTGTSPQVSSHVFFLFMRIRFLCLCSVTTINQCNEISNVQTTFSNR